MVNTKCCQCGGTLIEQEGTGLGVCEYCGTKQPFPKLSNDEMQLAYEKADSERRDNNFDNAINIFNQLVIKAPDSPDVYWEIVLCRYGIVYEKDPATGKQIPTINRTQRNSIFNDPDYQKALEYAEPSNRYYYEEEAAKIEKIREHYIQLIQSEEPYDVFICFKETDYKGGRTPDSVYAQTLYDELIRAGYKVFFSRVSLADKAGSEFEPIIYAALTSAKIMFVFGTRDDYVNAPWVRNEWSRYLNIMGSSRDRIIIPMYENVIDYFPPELRKFQGYDLKMPGWWQDAKTRAEKFVPKQAQQMQNTAGSLNTGPNASKMLIRARNARIELGNFDSARQFIEEGLNYDPECADLYFERFLCSINSRSATIDEGLNEINRVDQFVKTNFNDVQLGYKYLKDEETQEKIVEYFCSVITGVVNYVENVAETYKNNWNSFLDAVKKASDIITTLNCSLIEDAQAKYDLIVQFLKDLQDYISLNPATKISVEMAYENNANEATIRSYQQNNEKWAEKAKATESLLSKYSGRIKNEKLMASIAAERSVCEQNYDIDFDAEKARQDLRERQEKEQKDRLYREEQEKRKIQAEQAKKGRSKRFLKILRYAILIYVVYHVLYALFLTKTGKTDKAERTEITLQTNAEKMYKEGKTIDVIGDIYEYIKYEGNREETTFGVDCPEEYEGWVNENNGVYSINKGGRGNPGTELIYNNEVIGNVKYKIESIDYQKEKEGSFPYIVSSGEKLKFYIENEEELNRKLKEAGADLVIYPRSVELTVPELNPVLHDISDLTPEVIQMIIDNNDNEVDAIFFGYRKPTSTHNAAVALAVHEKGSSSIGEFFTPYIDQDGKIGYNDWWAINHSYNIETGEFNSDDFDYQRVY